MPRTTEYTSTRRLIMQAVLCVVLGISILLAWQVSRLHAARLLPDKWETRHIGNFTLDVPASWTSTIVSNRRSATIQLQEPRIGQRAGRTISIADDRIDGDPLPTAGELMTSEVGDALAPEAVENFDFLGQQGVLVEVPIQYDADGLTLGYLAACAVVPSRRIVWLNMKGPTFFAPADRELFKRVARSMKVSRSKGDHVAGKASQPLRLVDADLDLPH